MEAFPAPAPARPPLPPRLQARHNIWRNNFFVYDCNLLYDFVKLYGDIPCPCLQVRAAYARTHARTHARKHAYTHTGRCAHTHTPHALAPRRARARTHQRRHANACAHTHKDTLARARTRVRTHTHTHAQVVGGRRAGGRDPGPALGRPVLRRLPGVCVWARARVRLRLRLRACPRVRALAFAVRRGPKVT